MMKGNISINKYSGFFLIELLIAIGIFSLTCILVAKYHGSILERQIETVAFSKALNIANSLMEESMSLGISDKYLVKEDFKNTH